MIRYIDSVTGQILQHATNLLDEVVDHVPEGQVVLECDSAVSAREWYVTDLETGELAAFPPKPSDVHVWDWTEKAWLLPESANTTLAERLGRVLLATFRSLEQAPVDVNGVRYDADEESRNNINGVLDGIERDGVLPAGWIGWRDYDNQLQLTDADASQVYAELKAVARAIRDRKQALYIKWWAKKSAIDALTLNELMAYRAEDGWD